MNCEAARQAFLEADPEDLSSGGNAGLPEHLRTCPQCARVAAMLNEAHAQLAEHLEGVMVDPPAHVIDEVLRRSRSVEQVSKERRERILALGRRALAPLLTAAAIAGLMLWSTGRGPTTDSVPTAEAVLPAPPRVEAPAGTSVAVIQTKNPSITVVWLFAGGD